MSGLDCRAGGRLLKEICLPNQNSDWAIVLIRTQNILTSSASLRLPFYTLLRLCLIPDRHFALVLQDG